MSTGALFRYRDLKKDEEATSILLPPICVLFVNVRNKKTGQFSHKNSSIQLKKDKLSGKD